MRNFIRRAVSHHDKAVGLQGGLVFDHAVLRYANTVERGAQRAQAADHDRALDRGDDGGREIAQHDDLSDHWNGEKHPAEKETPEAAPECATRAPKFDPVAHVVEADNLFVGMIAFAD